MQTSLARRQRHRRIGNGRHRRPSGTARNISIAIPLFLFGSFVVAGLVGLVGAVAAYNYYSQGLADPRTALDQLTFDQQTVVYDRTGKIELARFGAARREVVSFDQIPPEMVDATTAIEDKTFWENGGFDPGGIISAALDTAQGNARGASTITQQLVRQRLLPQAVLTGPTYERKIKEIIQSVRLTQDYSGPEGKQAIITAYLNQNFYGNLSYGVAAAAQGYFGKPLAKLDLAQMAILAGIPQSPTKFDLMRNAVEECTVEVKAGADCPSDKTQLVVPSTSEIVQRRNYILGLMETRSRLSGSKHTADEYEAAKQEPAVLMPPPAQLWKAAQFVWQVRQQLGSLLCGPDQATTCEAVDTGGYHVTTTLDWSMQQVVDKWVYVSARGPNASSPSALYRAYKIPSADQRGWLANLRKEDINNAASAVADARTGQILAYAGSASYTAKGNKKFQPQWDVLSDSWRQPGSAIKPVDYSIGIDDHTFTAATMFMDVVTDFGNNYTPTQADKLERGPVRLREALQFSLNIPAIKAGFYNGLQHQLDRTKDFGINYLPKTVGVASESIGTLGMHPIDLLGAYTAIANGGELMPRTMILKVTDASGNQVWPAAGAKAPSGKQVVSPQTAYIISDILSGNTNPKVNPYWGEWDIVDGSHRRDAAYKTGTTSDTRDVAAYGFLAPPKSSKDPQLVVGVWMGNSDNTPTGSLSLDLAAPLWSRIMRGVSTGEPSATFEASKPSGLVSAKVDAYSGMKPGSFTTRTISELFIKGTAPTEIDNTKVGIDIDAATGDRWADGCAGPMVTRGFLDFSNVEPNYPKWARYTRNWAARAAAGMRRGGPEGTRPTYFYGGFYPFGRTFGASFAPSKHCSPPPPPSPSPPVCDPITGICESPTPSGSPQPTPKPSKGKP